MHSTTTLPEGYREIAHINLQKDKKTALKINIAGAVIMIALFVLAHFALVPITTIFNFDTSFASDIPRFAALILGYIAYIILHELTHAAVMKLMGGTKFGFGFTGIYAYAGSDKDYFSRAAYIAVALAPLIVWGIIFTVLLIVFPRDWFWVAWFWQVGNISGAAGDVYVTAKILKMPPDVLVMDTGVDMTFYSKER